MKYSSLLLQKYIDIPVSVEQLANDLTLKTCEVEEIFERKLPDLVLVGKVLDVWKHPNADTLFVTKIDCGPKGIFQICTGGENVSKNSFVPVAVPGCYLPALDLTIGERKMRGEESNGMICSKRELGFNEDEEYHWIWTLQLSKNPEDYASLPEEWKDLQGEFLSLTNDDCGKMLKEVFPWMESFVLDVDNKTLTHRPDLFGHYGLAQEIGAIYGTNLPPQAVPLPYQGGKDRLSFSPGQGGYGEAEGVGKTKITISTPLCSFYGAISGSMKTTHPQDAKEKRFQGRVMLGDLGLQARQDWVNFSNLYMYMTGQPVHVFDADTISGGIMVRQAEEGEKFLDLTGKEHRLSAEDIVIADDKKVLALAGIIGGLDSAFSDATKRIIIEVAHFDPVQVRKTGMRLGIRTDAQQRYEKHINPLWTQHCFETMKDGWNLDEVLENIVVSSSNPPPQAVPLYPQGAPRPYQGGNDSLSFSPGQGGHGEAEGVGKQISFDLPRCSTLIYGDATSLDEQDFRKVLMGLGFEFLENGDVVVPVRRGPNDITIEDDLVEEYIRIKGYETITLQPLTSVVEAVSSSDEVLHQRFVEQALVRQDFNQVETYPRCNEIQITDLSIALEDCYRIKNPIDANYPYLRPTMLWSMLGAVEKNAKNFETMKLFDTGKVWKSGKETSMLGLCLVAPNTSDVMQHPFVKAKSIIEAMIADKTSISYVPHTSSSQSSLFHPLQQLSVKVGDTIVGTIATIHPAVLATLGVAEDTLVVFAEISMNLLGVDLGVNAYESNEQQFLRKEAGFLFDKAMSYDGLMQEISTLPGVIEAKIIDIYTGDRIPADKKNITISIKVDATGKDGEYANEVLWKMIETGKSLGGEMRG